MKQRLPTRGRLHPPEPVRLHLPEPARLQPPSRQRVALGLWAAVATALWCMLLTSCSATGTAKPGPDGSGSEVVVFAAASLTGAFTAMGERFQAGHPGVSVRFNFAGSSDLVAQLRQGAQADVLATADEATMAKAVSGGLTDADPQPCATNTMAIAVQPGNPDDIRSFADLTHDGLQIVACAPQVPCGAAAAEVERKTGVDLQPVSEELSVTDVLGKVANGQADAGVVYRTDVARAGETVTGVPIPADDNAINTYPIAVLAEAPEAQAAEQFRQWVLGPEGREVLAAAGFGVPAR